MKGKQVPGNLRWSSGAGIPIAEEVVMTGTRPPKEFELRRFHWLFSERASMPIVAEWFNECWLSASQTIPPQEMQQRGWEWYAPVDPPPKKAHELATFKHFPELE